MGAVSTHFKARLFVSSCHSKPFSTRMSTTQNGKIYITDTQYEKKNISRPQKLSRDHNQKNLECVQMI